MFHEIRWTAQKIAQRLELLAPLVYRRAQPLAPFRYCALPGPQAAAPTGSVVDDGAWPTIAPHTHWGVWDTSFVLRGQFSVPADWPPDAPVALFLPLGEAGAFSHPEALAYLDGTAYAACDRHHQEILLPAHVRDGAAHTLALHGWTGGGDQTHEPGEHLLMRPCSIVQIEQPLRDFIATARVALGAARSLGDETPVRGRLLHALDAAFKLLDLREPFGDALYASVAPAHAALRAGIATAGAPLDAAIVATGHAHIDVAWLWTLGQTRQKAARTFHTVLRLMEQFPDYHFTQSQPQLYDYVREDHPALLDAIKARVAEGRWELIGDMWIEADCNLSGPESLARQFLLGRAFFDEHFGRGSGTPVLWLPDVFGYAWALPQLIKQAGLEYFFTIKIGWSQYNRLPYDSFWWQGLDGTRVLTHFSTTPEAGSAYASTYNAKATAEDTLGTWRNFKQKDLGDSQTSAPLLMAFGYGDGGGGPTREMLENLRELAHVPGLPRVRQGDVGAFFRALEADVGERLPTWNGELYLEYHRGTYTTQSRNKRANRKSEFLLHDAEFVATLATLVDNTYVYPAADLRRAWELICLNQFHDIIPGSSIGAVYAESLAQYAEVQRLAETARDAALATIAAQTGGALLVVNATGFARADLALWPGQLGAGQSLQREGGEAVLTQATADGTLIALGDVAPHSVTPLTRSPAHPLTRSPAHPLTATATLLENKHLRVELDAAGDITRIYDKPNRREVLPPGALANQFQAFEDRPLGWDAWDVDIFYDDKMWLAEPASAVRVVEAGPLRATLAVTRRIGSSSYTQRISLAHDSARLDFDTHIDWCERHVLLKVAFPVDILAPVATYEIQWGNVQRPTHRNTSWDWARFETCAQKWVDLSEGGYGVSLLNDCKYGHDIRANVLRISLLRAPTYPDPEADQGAQHFAYSLLPHAGGWDERTIAAAYALNDPLLVYATDQRPTTNDQRPTTNAGSAAGVAGQGATNDRRPASDETRAVGSTAGSAHHSSFVVGHSSFLTASAANIVIETVKRAEDGNGVIVRMYESQRRRGPVALHVGFPLAAAFKTNLLERDDQPLDVDGQRVTLAVRPFEIITLRLVPA